MLEQAHLEGLQNAELKKEERFHINQENIKAVPADLFFELHEYLDNKLGPGFAVRVGQQMKIEDYGVLGLSWRTCLNAGEIFKRCERYFHLLSNTYVFKVIHNGAVSDILLNRDAERKGIALSNEATFSATVVVLQAMTETDIHPIQVSFKHEAPLDLFSHSNAFGCPVYFNQPDNIICYKTQDLEIRTAKCDQSIHAFLMERVAEEEKGIEISSIKIASDVESLIMDYLPSGIPSIGHIGQHMGMSSRTLTRRLAENGLNFRDLVRNIQERLSKKLLIESSDTISEIAFQTGFSEQSAFSRAFKRWTGISPIEFRAI